MCAKLLGGCLVVTLLLSLLAFSLQQRPNGATRQGAAAEDDDNPLTQRAWASLAESASQQTQGKADEVSLQNEEVEDDVADERADPDQTEGTRVERYAAVLFAASTATATACSAKRR